MVCKTHPKFQTFTFKRLYYDYELKMYLKVQLLHSIKVYNIYLVQKNLVKIQFQLENR